MGTKKIDNYFRLPQSTLQTLVHYDLRSEHILIKNDGDIGIIDFGDVYISDPANDFTKLWEYGADFVKDVTSHYTGTMDEYFLERSKIIFYMSPVLNILYRQYGINKRTTLSHDRKILREITESGI